MEKDIERVLLTEEQLREKVRELGAQISRDYAGKKLMLVSVLKGSIAFMADLMRSITIPVLIDFMYLSSYGTGTASHGAVKIIKDLDISVEGCDVLIVEDILDSGFTLSKVVELFENRNANSVRLCAILDKPERRNPDVHISLDYKGFTIPDEFVVGYGLDYAERYRNLPYVGVLKREVYQGK